MLLTRVRFPSPAPPGLGLLAQLVRALPSHGRGRWFESSTAHHIFPIGAPAPFFVPNWKFGSLEAWKFGLFLHGAPSVAPQGRSVLRFPFSGAAEPPLETGVGGIWYNDETF